MILGVVILVVLILISGVLSASEIALSSSNRNKVKMLAEDGDKRASRLLAAIEEPHNFFATTQLYITFIAFFCGAYAANIFTEPLVGLLSRTGLPISENVAEPLVFIIITAVLTYVALVFGELVPKRIAMQYAIPFALRTLPVIKALSMIALPVVKLLSASAKLVLKVFRYKEESTDASATKEEIIMMVESSSEQGHIAESEQGMIENIFNIEKLTAGDICTHRLNIEALPIDADFGAVLNMLSGEFFSRVPIYEENLDNIRGILYTKDIVRFLATGGDPSGFDIRALMREAHFVPLSKRADELFQEMRKERNNIEVVVDEYGGTMGIVTMEDMVESIVGSIHDEYDVDELPDIAAIGENEFRIQGTASLEAVQDHFGVPLPIDDYDTLSGFLVGRLGHILAEDERPEVEFDGLLFKVESLQDKRIATVTVMRSADRKCRM